MIESKQSYCCSGRVQYCCPLGVRASHWNQTENHTYDQVEDLQILSEQGSNRLSAYLLMVVVQYTSWEERSLHATDFVFVVHDNEPLTLREKADKNEMDERSV